MFDCCFVCALGWCSVFVVCCCCRFCVFDWFLCFAAVVFVCLLGCFVFAVVLLLLFLVVLVVIFNVYFVCVCLFGCTKFIDFILTTNPVRCCCCCCCCCCCVCVGLVFSRCMFRFCCWCCYYHYFLDAVVFLLVL